MKKLVFFLVIQCGFMLYAFAQSPDSFNYQMLIRNSEGDILSNEEVDVEISIVHGTATGMIVYTETFNLTTNQNGLISLKVGTGNTNDNFININWEEGVFFLKTTVDGIELGTTQLLSVPYAKYADKAGNTFNGDYNDLTNLPSFSGWDMNINDDFSGDYNDLNNTPDFNLWDKNAYDDFSGIYDDLVNIPTFSGWDKDVLDDFSGDYNDLVNTPISVDTSRFISIANSTLGDLAYFDGTKWQALNTGSEGQVLSMESALPVWKDVVATSTAKKIGELYLGGIIFYVSPDGQHGLITDLDDTSPGEVYSSGNTVTGALSFHDGFSNTDAILLIFPNSNAASICRLKGAEWYLPSVWEMKLLHIAAYEINSILENDGDDSTNGLDTTGGVYWTSTEFAANQAYDYSVISGVIIDDNKTSSYRVRAIRAF